MKINLQEIRVKDLVAGYKNDDEEGVVGYNGLLNIRPKYQREFIYKDKQRDAVIETVFKNFPLNVFYWVKNDDGGFELLDGQQRTISICEYVADKYSINYRYFHNLMESEKEQLLNYKLMVYLCEGTDKERLEWFTTINIAGEELTKQELRNAVYTGAWLTDAKRHFSKSDCPAYNLGKNYVKGTPLRQDYLETVLDWISTGSIAEYMAVNQNNTSANEIWLYFQNVINWAKTIFPKYRKEMKGIEWGSLYNGHRGTSFNPYVLEAEIVELMTDDDVTKKSGIYTYLLTRDPRFLSIRSFTDNQKREVFERQNGVCPICKKAFEIEEMEADHITPWCEGGKTVTENCQMLCKHDNRIKSSK